LLSYIEGDIADLYAEDEEAFAAFAHYALSTTIKKSAWMLGRNKKLVSLLFTKYDEALALLLLENNCAGIKEVAEGDPGIRRTIKTKYTCKGSKKSDGGCGWTEEGMEQFNEIQGIVEQSRNHGRRDGMERRIKEAYLVKRKSACHEEGNDEEDAEDGGPPRGAVRRERVIVCTGIPI
jgi:hypothetical protein